MEHVKIAYYILVQLVGAAAMAYAVLMNRAYRLPFLKPFVCFLGFNNILALINLTSAYACANLLGFCAGFRYLVLPKALGPAARLSQVGIVYALFAVVWGLRRRRLSRAFQVAFGAGTVILLASYVAWAILPPGTAWWFNLVRGQLIIFTLGILATLGALAGLILDSRKTDNPAERKAIRLFGFSYLAIYTLFIITFPLPVGIQFFPNALALLAINVIPLIWLGRPFADAYAASPAFAEDREAFETYCRTHGLTSRESGIIELILRGKSNAQIEKALFISIHTVKNHITNIYQKLGVRSRWQLISLFHSGWPHRPQARASVLGTDRTLERGPKHE